MEPECIFFNENEMRKVFQDVISVIVFEIWPGIICEHGTKNFPLAYDLWMLKSVW